MDEVGKKAPPGAKRLRNKMIQDMSAQGYTGVEISKATGLNKNTVSKILNSEETATLIAQAESRVTELLTKAINVIEEEMDDVTGANRLRAAIAVAKSKGVIRETIDIAAVQPRPFSVLFRDGGKFVLSPTPIEDDKEKEEG